VELISPPFSTLGFAVSLPHGKHNGEGLANNINSSEIASVFAAQHISVGLEECTALLPSS
jgi:hypothetical protein